jgi:hypothetical protein
MDKKIRQFANNRVVVIILCGMSLIVMGFCLWKSIIIQPKLDAWVNLKWWGIGYFFLSGILLFFWFKPSKKVKK